VSPPSPPHLQLTPAALAAIYEHARRDYPRECCGFVFGPVDAPTADEARACRNIQDELHAEDPTAHPRDARKAYHFDGRDLLALNKSLRGQRPAKIIYHSHVDVGAYFSPTDQREAQMEGEPTFPVEYVVVDVRAEGAREAIQYAWSQDAKEYVEVGRY
jgi:proteasome lid subunit RPN8/RPN11